MGGRFAESGLLSLCFVLGCSAGSPPAAAPSPSPTVTLTVSLVAPATVLAGSGATTVTVTGTGFSSATAVQVGGIAEATTFVSSTQVTAVVPASQLVTAGTAPVVATNGVGSVSSGAVSLQINNPVPTISQFSPATLTAGAGATAITVTGTNFVSTTTIQIGGSSRTTTVASATQLTFQLTASDLAAGGSVSFLAANPLPGGGPSATSSLAVNNPVPILTVLSPNVAIVGATPPTTISVTGAGFLPVSTVQVGGSARPTSYASGAQMTFQLSAADQATAGNLNVTVVNPAPGGGTSGTGVIAVGPATPTPVLSSVAPSQIVVNSGATTLSVLGTNFNGRSVVQWNGASLATLYTTCVTSVFTPCLRATVPASLLTALGSATVTVTSPTSTPAVSNGLTVSITNPPVPTLTSLSVSAGAVNTAVAVTVTGTGFVGSSTVTVNGGAVATTFVSSTTLMANVPAASLPAPGLLPVAVSTPAPGGGVSNVLYFTAFVALPNNSMVYNPANGLFYLSVPSAAGAPYGNTIVSIDPLTGITGQPIPVGSEPNRLAITSDGKYLWVALDGAAAVRRVDLTTGTAGPQFAIGVAGSSTDTVAALAALPGSPDSVVVSTYYGGYTTFTGEFLTIYDSGVARAKRISFATYAPFPWALVVNGAAQEIYGPGSVLGSGAYITYNYDATGVTQKASTNSALTYATSNNDDVQVVGNMLYTDYGQAVDAETGALLGTFRASGTTAAAQGSITVDPGLGKAFILGDSLFAPVGQSSGVTAATLTAFNTADYTATRDAAINLSLPAFRASYQYAGNTGARLTRWGRDGLAMRGTGGFVSLRAGLVQDLSTLNADVAVSVAGMGTALTGANTTFTATVTNNGPSAASAVSLVAAIPSTGVLVSAIPTTGTCTVGSQVVCDLRGLGNGGSAAVAFTVMPLSAGTATLTAQVSASEADPTPLNNAGNASVTVTGSTYNVQPGLTAISPAGVVSGSPDTTIMLTGSNFSRGATVQLNGATIQTSYVSATQLTATVPAANLAALGWAGVSVVNPIPGGGVSAVVPLYVFSVLAVNASHVVYDPYTRRLMAGLSSGTTGTTGLAGNSLVAITPETASTGTPVALGGTPAGLALSSDGQYLYALLPNATSGGIARFRMQSQQVDFTASGFQATGYNVGLRDLATLPGSANTLAVDEGEYPGLSLFDFDGGTRTATRRGTATGIYTGTCPTFADASRVFTVDLYSGGGALYAFDATAGGLRSGPGSVLQGMNCTKVDGGLLYGQAGGVAAVTNGVPTQAGTLEGLPFVSNYGAGIKDFAPDASLGRSFYLTSRSPNGYSALFDSITAYDTTTFLPTDVLPLPFASHEAAGGFTGVDVVRWGQDGLAVLSSGGTVYLVRGPVVLPRLLGTNVAATLTSSLGGAPSHGSGNVLLSLSGTNFLPGMAVTWNGSYRSTTVVSSTQATVAIPASDLAATGTALLVATNPGAAGSAALTVTVQ